MASRPSAQRRAFARRAAIRNRRTSFVRSSRVRPERACVWTTDPVRIRELVGYRPFSQVSGFCLTHRLADYAHPDLDLGRFRDRAQPPRWWFCGCHRCCRPSRRLSDRDLAAELSDGYWEWFDGRSGDHSGDLCDDFCDDLIVIADEPDDDPGDDPDNDPASTSPSDSSPALPTELHPGVDWH